MLTYGNKKLFELRVRGIHILCLLLSTVDKKIIDQKRQDNVDLCKMFNEERGTFSNVEAPPAYDHLTSSFMYENKFRYRRHIGTQEDFPGDANGGKARPKRHLQDRDDREDVDNNPRRGKREVSLRSLDYDFKVKGEAASTSRLNLVDQARVENLVEKLYDDMSEINGKNIKYRKKILETTTSEAPVIVPFLCCFLFYQNLVQFTNQQPESLIVSLKIPSKILFTDSDYTNANHKVKL